MFNLSLMLVNPTQLSKPAKPRLTETKKVHSPTWRMHFFYQKEGRNYIVAMWCIKLLLRFAALLPCQVFFLANLSIMLTTFGKNFSASDFSVNSRSALMAVRAVFLL